MRYCLVKILNVRLLRVVLYGCNCVGVMVDVLLF